MTVTLDDLASSLAERYTIESHRSRKNEQIMTDEAW